VEGGGKAAPTEKVSPLPKGATDGAGWRQKSFVSKLAAGAFPLYGVPIAGSSFLVVPAELRASPCCESARDASQFARELLFMLRRAVGRREQRASLAHVEIGMLDDWEESMG
jgi:hypothetical protein